MHDHPLHHQSKLLSMGSRPNLPRLSVCRLRCHRLHEVDEASPRPECSCREDSSTHFHPSFPERGHFLPGVIDFRFSFSFFPSVLTGAKGALSPVLLAFSYLVAYPVRATVCFLLYYQWRRSGATTRERVSTIMDETIDQFRCDVPFIRSFCLWIG